MSGTPQAEPPAWVKSSLSFANGNCVEVAELPGGGIGVRNSRDASGAVLSFTPDEWHAFLGGVRNGEFDRFGRQADPFGGHEFGYEPHSDLFRCVRCHVYEVTARAEGTIKPCTGQPPAGSGPVEVNAW